MKVILTQFDKKLGHVGDVVNVSDGLANNMLFPQGKAKPFTPQAGKARDQKQKHREDQERAERKALRAIADTIKDQRVVISAQAKGQTLFGSVHAKEIAAHIKEQHGVIVDERAIALARPMKEIGLQKCTVDFGDGISTGIIVEVVAQ